MFDRFTDRAKKVMNLARQESQRLNHEYLGTEHILLGLVQEGSGVAAAVLKDMGVDLRRIRAEVEKIVKVGPSPVAMGQLPFTPRAKKVLELALEEASNLGHNYIGTEHLLLGSIKENEGIAAQVLANLGVRVETLREAVLEYLGVDESRRESITTPQPAAAKAPPPSPPEAPKSATPALDAFGTDLTQRARRPLGDPCVGREPELSLALEILCRAANRCVLLVGEPGAGKSAVLAGLAQRLANADVPEPLHGLRLVRLDFALMVAGTKYRGQFEERLKAVLTEVRRAGDVVLAIEAFHKLVGAGQAQGAGEIDAASMLEAAVAEIDLRCVATATPAQQRRVAEAEPGLARRFQAVRIEPATPEETLAILQVHRYRLETHHRVRILDEALQEAIEAAALQAPHAALPAAAIDLLDHAGARAFVRATAPTPDGLRLKGTAEALERDKEREVAQQDFERAADLRHQAHLARAALAEHENARKAALAAREWLASLDAAAIRETVAALGTGRDV